MTDQIKPEWQQRIDHAEDDMECAGYLGKPTGAGYLDQVDEEIARLKAEIERLREQAHALAVTADTARRELEDLLIDASPCASNALPGTGTMCVCGSGKPCEEALRIVEQRSKEKK